MINDILMQEKEYTFSCFTHQDAYYIGQNIINQIQESHAKPVRIRITLHNDIVFQYLMEGKTGETWLDKKQRTVEKFKHSSYYIYLQNEENHQYDYLKDQYSICGGGFPITVNHQVIGSICVSGLQHNQDHQLIIYALQCLKEKRKEELKKC